MRSGTENVFGIKCFEFASLKKYENLGNAFENVKRLNETMRKRLDSGLFKILSSENSSPYILSVAATGLRGETVLHEADDSGIIIGTGSACSSNASKRYSRIILACGVEKETADGVLRISFSTENTVEEVEKAAEILNRIVKNRKQIMA